MLLVALAAWGQKKPITIDALRGAARAGRNVTWAPDGKSFAFLERGELKVYDVTSRKAKSLVTVSDLAAAAASGSSAGRPYEWTNRHARTDEMEWSQDSKSLLYAAEGDLFMIHASGGEWAQLTKTPEAELDPKFSPDCRKVAFRRGWDLYVVDIATKRETRLTLAGSEVLRNGGLDWVYPEEIGLDTAFWWSPDSRFVAYLQFDVSQEPLFPHGDLLRPRAIYEPERYPQAGEHNATIRLGVVPAAGGRTRWLEAARTDESGLLARVGWLPDSQRLYFVRLNRVQNRLEALAVAVDSGKALALFRESDQYWINLRGDLQFLKDGQHFLWTSERDGHRHVYLYANDGTDVKQVTRGDWEVFGITAVDDVNKRLFYTSSEPTHLEKHLYVIDWDGRNKRRLTEEPGMHEISMAQSGAFYLDTFSSLRTAPRTVLHSGDGRALGLYREPERRETEEYAVLPAEILSFAGADGIQLYGRLIRPAGFQSGRQYPVVVTVYGGPDISLPVHNEWPGITMDQALAHHGYVVWQAENRGGAGRGHAFETSIYHKLGVTELADQVAGVRHLISLGFADPKRIGIRGASYGGFMTVNALLNAPDVFRAGFATAPVTSWLNYDSIYTERYMGLPAENEKGYSETALARSAGNLKGKLMLAHNFEDDNVLFQNTLQLTSALQTAGKQFEMMLYPQKTHGITGPDLRHENQLMLDFFDRALK